MEYLKEISKDKSKHGYTYSQFTSRFESVSCYTSMASSFFLTELPPPRKIKNAFSFLIIIKILSTYKLRALLGFLSFLLYFIKLLSTVMDFFLVFCFYYHFFCACHIHSICITISPLPIFYDSKYNSLFI